LLTRIFLAAAVLQPPAQDPPKTVDQVMDAADRILDEARKVYESGKSRNSMTELTSAAFLAEEARLKYQAAQEFASGPAQTRAASQFRVANQLTKLINDARKAAEAPGAAPAPEPPRPPPAEAKPVQPLPTRRPSAPSRELLEAADKKIKEVFKAEFAQKGLAERRALARKLLSQAAESAGDPTVCWALLREARELAIQAGDADIALSAIEALDRGFEVDANPMKATALAALARNAKAPEDLQAVARRTREWAEEETDLENYPAAEKAWAATATAARKAGDVATAAASAARAKDVANLKSRYESFKTQREALANHPADPAANQGVGEYLCFVKKRWEAGLPLLAKGGDAALKAIALRDLPQPAATDAQISLGDAWWDHAARAKADAREAMRERAAHWYTRALPSAEGIEKLRLRKRLEEMETAGSKLSGAVDLLRMIEPSKDAVHGTWSLEDGGLACEPGEAVRLQIPYVPPDEYDLNISFERKAGNRGIAFILARGSAQWGLGWDYFPTQGYRSGLLLLDGAEIAPGASTLNGPQLANGKKHELSIQVRRTGLRARLDGKAAIEWDGAFTRLALPPNSKLPQADTLGLLAWGNRVHFSKVTLTPVSGSGRKLR
jgi:hypothetical protein